MQITGIEVLGRKVEGPPIEAVPGETLQVTYGNVVRISVAFDYRGRARDITLYGSIGQRQPVIGFVELLSKDVVYRTPDSPGDFVALTASVDISITADIDPGPDYDIYCKILEYPEAGHPEVSNAIYVTGIPPTYELLEETIYPYAYIYQGDCDISTFTFRTDPFTPASWIAGQVTAAVEDETRKAGGNIMEMRVYVDTAPLLWTDWRVEVVGVSLEATAGPGIWAVVILAALVVIGIIAATLLVKEIVGIFKRKPGLDDVKVGWGSESLIMTIQDSEKYWDRPLTPLETLQAMSAGELRHYLNEIAKEELPTGISWLPWLVIGGVVLVGGGTAVALTSRRK